MLSGLDVGRVVAARPAVRVGSSAEFLAAEMLRRIAKNESNVVARFGSDDALISDLERGELDVAITSTTPPRRGLGCLPIGEKQFVLVGRPELARRGALLVP